MKLEKIKSTKLDSPSFGGYKDAYKADGQQAYKFYAPNFDKDKYSLILQVVPVESTRDGYEVDKNSIVELNTASKFENNEPVLLPKGRGNLVDEPQFGYRFKLVSKENGSVQYLNDPGMATGGEDKFTIVLNNAGGVAKQGPMYHLFPDSYNVENKTDMKARTHFNIAGGNIRGVIAKLKNTNELDPYKLIISTPLFGADEVTSHGYWTSNPFQISSQKGSLNDFKDLNVELFKQGKQFVADGAFTSQGFESPFLQHALKWGAESPYYNWFKFDYTGDEKGSKIAVGILPDCENPLDKRASDGKTTEGGLSNACYRVVNSPFEKGYNKTNPTYLQFYDPRLVDEIQLADSKKLIRSYANKNPEDLYDIYNHQDSVQPFAFEIRRTNENDARLEELTRTQRKPLSKINNYARLLEFDNFAITHKSRNGGANYWDGQLDLVKLNLGNPTAASALGSTRARNNLYNAATYWTKTVNDALVLSLAKEPTTIKDTAIKNGIANYKQIEAQVVSGGYRNNLFKEDMNTDKFILNELSEFPLESIEVSPNLSAILGSPYFTPSAKDASQINTNRADLALKGPSAQIYKNITEFTKAVLVKMDSSENPIFNNGDLTEYGKFVTRFIAPDMAKFAVVRSLFPKLITFTPNEITFDKKLREMSTQDILSDSVNCNKEADAIRNAAQINSSSLIDDVDKVAHIYRNKFEGVTLENIKLAQAVVEQSGAGLNWRFDAAKDVADLDVIRAGAKTSNNGKYAFDAKNPMDDAMKEMTSFWKPFVANIKKQNPNALTIAEMTCLGDLYGLAGDKTYPKAQSAEKAFYTETGATTGSSYSYLFSTIPMLYGASIENGIDEGAHANWIFGDILRLLQAGSYPFIQNSHIFVDNHDKPRALHSFSIDNRFFLSEFSGKVKRGGGESDESYNARCAAKKEEEIRDTKKLLGDDVNFNHISSKGVAVADAYIRTINALGFDNDTKEALINGVKELAQGKTKGGVVPNKGRSEAFGFRPFEVTVKDVIGRSGLKMTSDQQKTLENEIIVKMTEKGREKLVNMWEILCATVGIPTLFSGTEFSQTGYETPSKNKELGCRGVILHSRANSENPLSGTYKNISAISGLSKLDGMSALSGGTPIMLKNAPDSDAMFPIYKYDDKGSEVITLVVDPQASNHEDRPYDFEQITKTVNEINIQPLDDKASLDGFLTNGEKFSRKVLKNGQYVDEAVKYLVKDGKLVREDGRAIELKGGANFFYRKDSSYAPSFTGNPKIELHNKKYLIH